MKLKLHWLRWTLAATTVATAAMSTAQIGTGGAPTGHRSKLMPVPARPHPPPGGNGTQFGDPVVGLTAEQQAAFSEGREEFESIETAEGGLGPIFNNDSCAVCHSTPLSGGASAIVETRFGRSRHGQFDPLANLGGSLLQQFATNPIALEHVPTEANVVAKRLTTPLFGAGLIEAIPDAEIAMNALRRQPDGVNGRASRVLDPASGTMRVGRFGWKEQHASLLGFAADAYLNEMGVTSRLFPTENAPNGDQALLAKVLTTTGINDPPNPVTGRGDIDASADFMRLLGPPPPVTLTSAAVAGQQLFDQLKCTACHLPMMISGESPVHALAFKTVPLYSDLLLHDMGALGDGIVQGPAGAREMRTAPLWGLRARGPFLHDGRASSVNDAVLAHDGEGAAARERYRQLSSAELRQLLAFLNSI